MNETTPTATLYHDGCAVCLGIAATLAGLIPGLDIVDLGQDQGRLAEAGMLGIVELPCLVVGGEVLPIAQHSTLAGLAAGAHG